MKVIFETAVAQPRFNMNQVYIPVKQQASTEQLACYRAIEAALGKSASKRVIQGLIRFAFFIEPVKIPKIESTKYAVRWGPDILSNDPRFAVYLDCVNIYDRLLKEMCLALDDDEKREMLLSFGQKRLLAYEMPLDYFEHTIDRQMHRPDNIVFLWDALPYRVARLRKLLLSNSLASFFRLAYGKIAVKTYLTDRVLTGLHKTNREKRWETHPGSVHFALRRDCLEVELVLMSQLCYFAGFPRELQQELESEGVISFVQLQESGLAVGQEPVSRCPITLEPLSFEQFALEILTPRHGKATYQVGHIHPLKAVSDQIFVGHTGKNVSWISAQGNRIQGEYSVAETRKLIFRIIQNYRDAGLVS